jgi:hypothetical protein
MIFFLEIVLSGNQHWDPDHFDTDADFDPDP